MPLRILNHVYWRAKKQFMLESDVYRNWTMFAVEEGRFAYEIGESRGEAGFGDLVVCPPGLDFHRRTLEPLTFHYLEFAWEDPEGEAAGIDPAADWGKAKRPVADLARLTSTYRHWVRTAESWDEADRKWKDHLLNDLWRLLAAEKAEEARNGGRDGIPADPLMEKAEKALSRQAYEPFSMRELAESLGLRPVPFTRRFHKHAGMTPSAYVTELRMNRACRLLTETNLPLDSVARQCGYENGFYLSRVFLERVGVRPSVYRKTRRV